MYLNHPTCRPLRSSTFILAHGQSARSNFSIHVTHVAPHASVAKSPANGTRQTGMWWDKVETGVASWSWPCPFPEISVPG